jgi:hypothetical protein
LSSSFSTFEALNDDVDDVVVEEEEEEVLEEG